MQLSADQPIGIFDSGIGGLTVANAISKALPSEHLIYYGDTVHLPYGDKSADAIRYYCLKIGKFLVERNCKMIIIACNSASTAAYDLMLEFFADKTLIVNVVDPLVEAVVSGHFHKVGVIATKATIGSNVYKQKIESLANDVEVSQLATPLLVPMIEEGFHSGKISGSIIENYLSQGEMNGIDALLLACTHYPLIKKEIVSFFKNEVKVLDSTDVVTSRVRTILSDNDLLFEGMKHREDLFFISDYTQSFEDTSSMFYGRKVNLQINSIW